MSKIIHEHWSCLENTRLLVECYIDTYNTYVPIETSWTTTVYVPIDTSPISHISGIFYVNVYFSNCEDFFLVFINIGPYESEHFKNATPATSCVELLIT